MKRCEGRTNGHTNWIIHRAAWSQLKILGHLFDNTSSFVHRCEFKLELQSGNVKFGQNRGFFFTRVTLKFDRWPWKITGHLFYAMLSSVHHYKAIDELKLDLQSGNPQFGSKSAIVFVVCDREIWWSTFKVRSYKLHIAVCIISKPWVN